MRGGAVSRRSQKHEGGREPKISSNYRAESSSGVIERSIVPMKAIKGLHRDCTPVHRTDPKRSCITPLWGRRCPAGGASLRLSDDVQPHSLRRTMGWVLKFQLFPCGIDLFIK